MEIRGIPPIPPGGNIPPISNSHDWLNLASKLYDGLSGYLPGNTPPSPLPSVNDLQNMINKLQNTTSMLPDNQQDVATDFLQAAQSLRNLAQKYSPEIPMNPGAANNRDDEDEMKNSQDALKRSIDVMQYW